MHSTNWISLDKKALEKSMQTVGQTNWMTIFQFLFAGNEWNEESFRHISGIWIIHLKIGYRVEKRNFN